LYRRARAGEIADFTGISSPYEEPDHPSWGPILRMTKPVAAWTSSPGCFGEALLAAREKPLEFE